MEAISIVLAGWENQGMPVPLRKGAKLSREWGDRKMTCSRQHSVFYSSCNSQSCAECSQNISESGNTKTVLKPQ